MVDVMAMDCLMFSSSPAAQNDSNLLGYRGSNLTDPGGALFAGDAPLEQNLTGMDDEVHMAAILEDPVIAGVKYYLSSVVSPLLCAIGLTGNVLNILVLTRRRIQSAIDCSMERAAYMGLIALAVSDFLYCLSTLPDAFLSRQHAMFTARDFWLYYTVGGKYLQNVFSHISTWLTVIMAGGRYAAICHPLHARLFVHAKGTRIAIAMVFFIWACLGLPILWTYSIYDVQCRDGSALYILDHGSFTQNQALKTSFMYVWTVFGYVVPVCVLAYCNAHLIKALRESYKMRQEYRVHGRTPQHNTRITPTLVAIVIMFIVLVSPSEIIQFIFYAVEGTSVETLNLVIVITNILHTMNFAVNFILYCCVNSHFRDTLRDIICVGKARRRLNRNCTYTATYSNVTSRTYAAPSTETIL